MVHNWKACRLADVCQDIDYGYTASAIDTLSGTKFLRITDIVPGFINWDSVPYCEIANNRLPRYLLSEGDIVIARTGATTGSSAYISKPPQAVFASYLVRLKIKRNVCAKFVSLYLKSEQFWNYLRGVLGEKSAQPNASASTMVEAPLHLPPLAEQETMAEIFGALNDKIELNRSLNRTLESMAQALFKEWFIDFGPVRAKAEIRRQHPRWTNEQVSRAALPAVDLENALLFPDSFDEKTANLPTGWRREPIGDMVQVLGGGTPSTNESTYWDNGIHYFCTPKDMSSLESPILLGTERKLTDSGIEKVGSGLLPKGIVLLSSRAPIGYLAISGVPVAVNQGIIAMLCGGLLSNVFVYHWTRSNMAEIISHANGSTFLEISKRNFKPLKIICPPSEVTHAFTGHARELHDKIEANAKQSKLLSRIRDMLLPKLISGEIRIKDAEKLVGKVV